ncbi:MAG: hypothetical protein OXC66_00220 [Roseovarius sp.]|nr:hypothetical protein [Roseovarius sp.]
MKPVAGGGQAIIAIDASVLINFLRIDRTDLLAGHSRDFLATDCAASEIADRYPDQQQRFAKALKTGTIAEARVARKSFGFSHPYSTPDAFGAGECPAIAIAVHRGYILAIDDRLAAKHALRIDATIRII